MKIDSMAALEAALASVIRTPQLNSLLAAAETRYGTLSDSNFYLVRDFLRLNWSGADGVLLDGPAWTAVDGGNMNHFLHVSSDDSNKVAYTKDEDRGRDDVQTRTTADVYFGKYGRASSNLDAVTVAETTAAPAKDENPEVDTDSRSKAAPVDVPNTKTLAETLGLLMALGAGQQDSGSDDDIVAAVNKALSILLIVVKK